MPINRLTITGLERSREYVREYQSRPEVRERRRIQNQEYKKRKIREIRERDREYRRLYRQRQREAADRRGSHEPITEAGI